MLLALDPSAHTGAAWEVHDGIKYATWDLGENDRARLISLADHLSELHLNFKIDVIGYETPWLGPNFTAVRALCHYEAIILAYAQRMNIKTYGYTPNEIKASIRVGMGNKESVIRGVRMCGFSPEDDNQADAIALLLMMQKGVMPSKQRKTYLKKATKSDTTLFTSPGRRVKSGLRISR
jgi:Holliday junction resolvasome RuvABC endonuclease subunit